MKTDKEIIETEGLIAQKELSPIFTDESGNSLGILRALKAKGFTNDQAAIVGRFMRCYQWYGFSQGENHVKAEFKKLFNFPIDI